ncbi:MAG: hypothetical protein U5R06_03760 [candidate division KSB1 bacterium]|nr:hypothetical protein [candidate division KSB1 bacterium]
MRGCLKGWQGSFAYASHAFMQSSREKMLEKDAWLFERLARQFRLHVSSIHAVKQRKEAWERCMHV